MNELDIIRAQLAREAVHVGETLRILARRADQGTSSRPELLEACATYLQFALTRLDAGVCAEAQQQLLAARAGSGSDAARLWRRFAEFFELEWSKRQVRIEAATNLDGSIAAWRAAAPIDADSILQERERYARITALCAAEQL